MMKPLTFCLLMGIIVSYGSPGDTLKSVNVDSIVADYIAKLNQKIFLIKLNSLDKIEINNISKNLIFDNDSIKFLTGKNYISIDNYCEKYKCLNYNFNIYSNTITIVIKYFCAYIPRSHLKIIGEKTYVTVGGVKHITFRYKYITEIDAWVLQK